MNIQEQLEWEMDNIPWQYKRPEKDADGEKMRHTSYWGREMDHAIWRKLKDTGLKGEELRAALETHWTVLDDCTLPPLRIKKLSKASRRKERELVESATALEAENDRTREDADIAKGLGLRDERTGQYFTHAEWADWLDYANNRAARRTELDKAQTKTPEDIAHDAENARFIVAYNQREELKELEQEENANSIEKYLHWDFMKAQPDSDATDEEREAFFAKQRGEDSSRYVIYGEKHFGKITHFCETENLEEAYDAGLVKDLLQKEYDLRASCEALAESANIQSKTRQDKIAHKHEIEQSVDSRETEGKVKGVVWKKDKNRWRVYIDEKHYGYYVTQLLAVQRAQEIRSSGL